MDLILDNHRALLFGIWMASLILGFGSLAVTAGSIPLLTTNLLP